MSIPRVNMKGFPTVYISIGSRPHDSTPLSHLQAVPVFVQSLECLCLSLDNYPAFARRSVGRATLMEIPCPSLDYLQRALESLLDDLSRSACSRLFLCNFIQFRHPSPSERLIAATALAHITALPAFYRRHVYNWGGYEFPKLLIRYDDRDKLPALNPLFIEKIILKNQAKFDQYTLDLTSPRLPPPFRRRKATRKRNKPVRYLKRFKAQLHEA
jgi:hypothetical protein